MPTSLLLHESPMHQELHSLVVQVIDLLEPAETPLPEFKFWLWGSRFREQKKYKTCKATMSSCISCLLCRSASPISERSPKFCPGSSYQAPCPVQGYVHLKEGGSVCKGVCPWNVSLQRKWLFLMYTTEPNDWAAALKLGSREATLKLGFQSSTIWLWISYF